MKCLDNLIEYNIDHVKEIAEVLKTPDNDRGFKNSRQ